MAEDNLRKSAPSRDTRFEDRVRRLVRPDELKSKEEQPWHGGRGTDVWEMITAAIRGDVARIRQLVTKDSRLVHCGSQYRAPLHFAVQENHIEAARFLLDHGADPSQRSGNPWHERPIVIAEERGYKQMKSLLEEHLTRYGGPDDGEEVAEAIRARDVDRVRSLLDVTPSLVEAMDARGNRPMHWAALTRNTTIVDLLLERGADINAQRPDGARPLDLTNGDYWFRRNRDVPIASPPHEVFVGYLVAKGADYDICVAAKVGDAERVHELLEHDPSLANRVPDYCTYYNALPLVNALGGSNTGANNSHTETVKVLLECGADPTTPEPGMAPNGRAVMAAVSSGNIEMVKTFLEQGADPNGPVESSGTPVGRAAGNKQWDILKLLLHYGGTFPDYMDLSDVDSEALAAVYGDVLPLKYYVDVEDTDTLSARFDEDPEAIREALHLSLGSYMGFRTKVLRLCLGRDSDVAKTVHCYDLIYKLHRLDEDEVLEPFTFLLEAGMTPNDPNWLRVTPLHLLVLGATSHGTDGSAYRPHPKMMKLFIEHGADLNARDEDYRSTPLGWAARWGRKEAVEMLLERGAQINLPDDPPWATPLAWARKKGHAEIEELLRVHRTV